MATSYLWLILGRVIQGVGSALYMTSATTWVAQASSGEYRGRFMAIYSGSIFAGISFGPVIGGYSAAYFGINAPFFIYGGFAVLGLLATIPLRETSAPSSVQETSPMVRLKDLADVFKNGSFILVNTSVLALFFLRAGVRATLIPLYASLNLGLTEEKIGLLMTVAAIATTVVTFLSGWFSDRVGRKIPIMSCLFLSAVATILIPSQETIGGLTAIMVLYGLATGLQGSIAAWPADVAPQDKLGTAMGVSTVGVSGTKYPGSVSPFTLPHDLVPETIAGSYPR
jgi:DHA1 family multidrug resistance protein-like MFS transporter